MRLNQVVRSTAFFGIIGTILNMGSIIGQIVYQISSYIPNLVGILAGALMVIGFFGAYLSQAQRLGKFGLFSFILLIIGMISINCFDMLRGLALPILQKYDPSIQFLYLSTFPSPLKEGLIISYFLWGAAMVLYGIALLELGKGWRWPGGILIVGGISGALQSQVSVLGLFGTLGFTIGTYIICKRAFNASKVNAASPFPNTNNLQG